MSIGQIGRFKQGSSNVVPFELEGANSAGDGMKMFGDIVGLGGTVALGKGLSAGAKDPWVKNGLDLRTVGKQQTSFGDKIANLFSPYR